MPEAPPAAEKPKRKPRAEVPPGPPSWEEYLTGKKVAPGGLLARMTKGGFPVPTSETFAAIEDAIRTKPERVFRLIALVQASAGQSASTREVVLDLAEAGLSGLGLGPGLPNSFDVIAWSWVRRANKRPLAKVQLGGLFLLLQVGSHRQLVDDATVAALLEEAATRPAKPGSRRATHDHDGPRGVSPLLTAEPSQAVLAQVLRVRQSLAAEAERLEAVIRARTAEVDQLVATRTALRTELEQARRDIEVLRVDKSAAEMEVARLQAQVVDVHDGYGHELRELRERTLGLLEGQLARWLRTSLAAARAEPPRVPVIEERLEDALTLIGKEIAWLQASA